jgi:hypothetical protein
MLISGRYCYGHSSYLLQQRWKYFSRVNECKSIVRMVTVVRRRCLDVIQLLVSWSATCSMLRIWQAWKDKLKYRSSIEARQDNAEEERVALRVRSSYYYQVVFTYDPRAQREQLH